MESPEQRVERKIAQTQAAAQARHEARQQRAAQRQAQQQAQRAAQRRAREQVGEQASAAGRPLAPDDDLHLHAVTVRLDNAQYRQLTAYTAAGGRTLAATIRALIAGRRVFTTEQHTLLRRVPDLVNATTQLAQQLASLDPVGAAEWRALATRVDEFLMSLHPQATTQPNGHRRTRRHR